MEENIEEFIDIFEKPSVVINKNLEHIHIPWDEKYRPQTIDDMILNETTKRMFKNMIAKNDLSNMTLFGSAGIGKTSLAKLLAKSVNAETLFIPCGTEGTVDTVRNRIQPFCESISIGRLKCIILDEFDSSSGGDASTNGMQKSLRSLIEAYTDTRFIITCNYPEKIIKPIFSRCPKVHIGFTPRDIAMRLKTIWDTEGITYDTDTANKFFVNFVKAKLPDIRSIIKMTQDCCREGKLNLDYVDSQINTSTSVIDGYAQRFLKMLQSGVDYISIRNDVIMNQNKFNSDYELLIGAVINCIVTKSVDTKLDYSIIPLLSEYAYRVNQVNDPSIQICGMIVSLMKHLR